MKRISEVLGVARSNLMERKAGRHCGRPSRYRVADDERLLPQVRAICADRGANGYRRVTAHLNRELAAAGERVNPKRIYRLMKAHDLLLTRHTGRPVTDKAHDGQVITLKSDLRWCSDVMEIRCWNGEAVRVAFSLDCCDREAMRYMATTGGVTSEMIQDLLVETMEYRFGDVTRLSHPIEWLSDNGSCYTAAETRAMARQLGFLPCTTAVRSPQSNGMAEAFVKTFKRDYVYLNDLPDAATVLAQLPGWFADYNRFHPHKGLKMQSPWEYRQTMEAAANS
ncbi:Transposase InsO and inactivated derivatives [Aquisalimonas asiatica]|uniref:Transposase InsO and inactivated derivatives n=1 Tax=Aquisalimonas asiatica TaxID=406100 RepID=A0A1H8QMC3_9GAMM|nr:Transposase InsO and inactivated derivatives [Aquisalimonas asiatica]